MHPEWIKRSFPWPGVLTSFYLSFSCKPKKFYRISKSPFFWSSVCLCAIVIQCNWILLYCFCFIAATCNSKVRLLGMRHQGRCACVRCICACEREGDKRNTQRDGRARTDRKERCSPSIKPGNVAFLSSLEDPHSDTTTAHMSPLGTTPFFSRSAVAAGLQRITYSSVSSSRERTAKVHPCKRHVPKWAQHSQLGSRDMVKRELASPLPCCTQVILARGPHASWCFCLCRCVVV